MGLLRRSSNASSASPPSYSTSTTPPPPFTAFPDRYTVGKHSTLFVNTDQLKRHLKLLGAFHRLRQKVENLEGGWTGHLDKKTRWSVFVNVAVHRLELYLDHVLKTPNEAGILRATVTPPLDVALALHSYQLNPGNFIEDAKRKTGISETLAEAILSRVMGSISDATYEQVTIGSDERGWLAATETTCDPILHFQKTKGIVLLEPRTSTRTVISWLTPDGRGYAQQNFSYTTKSGDVLTHETLGLCKLAKDIMEAKSNPLFCLAGTFVGHLAYCNSPDESARAMLVRDKVTKSAEVQAATTPVQLVQLAKWKREGADKLLSKALGRKNGHAVRNILSRYTRGERFSLDLAVAILRQGSFIDKMHSLGWLEPGRFDTDDTLLKRCVARYHAFCDLLSSTPSMFCVPTLDIDLGWHTHQLQASYRKDMVGSIGRFVDHDDKVEENALSTSFDVTARTWQARFGVPYSTCGCPLPSQPPLSRLAAKLSLTLSQPSYPSGTLSQLRPSLEDADATHASEHNSLVLPRHREAMKKRKEREAEMRRRKEKEDREWEKERRKREKMGGRSKEEEEEWRRRRAEHEAAFFYPVPLVPIYGPVGYPISAGGCCAIDGNSASGSSSTGTASCGSTCAAIGGCASGSSCASASNSHSACASCSSSSSHSGCGSSSSSGCGSSSGCSSSSSGGCGGGD